MKRGRPFQPGNKFGRGRPPGSHNKKTIAALELMDRFGEKVISKALMMALQGIGDPGMIRALLPHVLPRRKDMPIRVPRQRFGTIEEVDRASEATLKQVVRGRISPADGLALSELYEKRRQVIESRDLDRRVRALEANQNRPSQSTSHDFPRTSSESHVGDRPAGERGPTDVLNPGTADPSKKNRTAS